MGLRNWPASADQADNPLAIFEQYEDGTDSLHKITDPVPLNGDGDVLDDPSPANVTFLTFAVYKQMPFAAFGF